MTLQRNEPTDFRQQLMARLRFYRELGLTEFYRRPVPAGMSDGMPFGILIDPQFSDVAACLPDQAVPSVPVPSSSTQVRPIADNPPVAHKEETHIPPRTIFPAAPEPLPVVPPQGREAALSAIRAEIGDCTRCALHVGRNQLVFGDGNAQARLMFVGEGPGADEDAQGLPFVGKAGQLLNNMISAMGLKRADVYIANVVKCRPPGNRVPEPVEAHTCTPFLFRQIDVVHPEVIVALGATAATYLLGARQPLTGLRGRVHDWRGTKLIVTYHPAYLLRDPRQKKETWADLQIAMRELGMKLPGEK